MNVLFAQSTVKYLALLSLVFIFSACTINSSRNASPASTSIRFEQATATVEVSQSEQPTGQAASEAGIELIEQNSASENGLPLVARVNNQPIFLNTFEKQIDQFKQTLDAQGIDLATEDGQKRLTQIRRQVLDALIDQAIMEQEANKLGIIITEEILEAKAQESATQGQDQAQFEAWLSANNLTYEEFKETLRVQLIANQMFEQITRSVPETAEQIQLRQIIVADQAIARSLIEQLKSGASFSTLAQEYSLDQSSQANGGELGWFPRGIGLVPPGVESVAFSLEPMEVSGPIETSLGFYIIQLENREAERPLGTEMLQALKEQLFKDWLAEQRTSTIVERFVDL